MLYALEEGILCDWLGELIFLSLVSPKLEVGAKLGNLAVSYRSSPYHLGLIIAEAVGQSSILIYSLAIVHFYIQSQNCQLPL